VTKKLPSKRVVSAKRAPRPRAIERALPPRVDEHDEPIVVDNFPVRVDFGSSQMHPTTPGPGKSWKRAFSDDFHQLLVIFEDENGARQRHRVLNAVQGAKITFDLVRESDATAKETLKFELVSDGSGGKNAVMTPGNDPFVEENGQPGRLMPSTLTDLRLTKVSAGARSINLKPGGAFRKKVIVIIVGVPE
jgi:hypothetical protein